MILLGYPAALSPSLLEGIRKQERIKGLFSASTSLWPIVITSTLCLLPVPNGFLAEDVFSSTGFSVGVPLSKSEQYFMLTINKTNTVRCCLFVIMCVNDSLPRFGAFSRSWHEA